MAAHLSRLVLFVFSNNVRRDRVLVHICHYRTTLIVILITQLEIDLRARGR